MKLKVSAEMKFRQSMRQFCKFIDIYWDDCDYTDDKIFPSNRKGMITFTMGKGE